MCTFCFVIIGSYEVVMHLKIHVRRQSLFGNFCAERRALLLQLFFRKYCKKYLLLQNNGYFLELMAGLEPATYWLRISCSTNWATPAYLLFRAFYITILINNQRPADYESAALPTELHQLMKFWGLRLLAVEFWEALKSIALPNLHISANYYSIFFAVRQLLFWSTNIFFVDWLACCQRVPARRRHKAEIMADTTSS